jgi:benzoyl-CoA reductase/2-hydroxyglutaryl-CoA dehydratase subunit BcrC/BadD/HgdB
VRIAEAFEVYEDYRRAMRAFVALAADYPLTIDARTRHLIIKASYFMDKKLYTKEIRTIIDGLNAREKESFPGIRAVATGYIAEPNEVLSIFAENQIAIVADDIAQESRQFRTPAREGGTVWQRMTWRILDQRGCTFFCEEKKSRGQMLIDMVKASNAGAVVVCMMKFCDPEEFDYPIYKKQLEEAGIPILYLELDQHMDAFEQIRTRVQSFAEIMI